MEPSPKSLILDLLSTLGRSASPGRGAMPVRALLAAGALFGIAENSLRVALARLVARGLVERNERGSYRLAPAAAAVQGRISDWRRSEQLIRAWRGGWLAVHTTGLPRSPRSAVARRGRALELLGFRELASGLALRPANLRAGVDAVRARLLDLGLEPEAPVFSLADLDPQAERRARALWDAAALTSGYRATRRALRASARGLQRLSREQAMVETFLLGGRAIRQLVLDPLLPEPIVPAAERRELVQALRDYDSAGRGCWRAFMREHDAVADSSPANFFAEGDLGDAARSLPAA